MKPGWYHLPTDSTKLVYWDGVKWVGDPIPNPAFISHPDNPDGSVTSYAPKDTSKVTNSENRGKSYTSNSKGSNIISGVLFLFMGIIFITVCFGSFAGISSLTSEDNQPGRVKGTATVVAMEYTSEGYCIPQLQRNSDSPVVPADMTVHVSPCPVTVGEVVDVTYLETNPNSLKIENDTFKTSGTILSFLPLIFGLVGIILGIRGVVSIVKAVRQKA